MTVRPGRTRWVVCYDVVSDKRRAKVAKLADGYGDRVQDSVFEAWLTEALLEKLKVRMLKLIDREVDAVSFYRVCTLSEKPVVRIGKQPDCDQKAEIIAFVV